MECKWSETERTASLDVREHLAVGPDHPLPVPELEVELDDLLQCLEAPLALFRLHVYHLFKALQRVLQVVVLEEACEQMGGGSLGDRLPPRRDKSCADIPFEL